MELNEKTKRALSFLFFFLLFIYLLILFRDKTWVQYFKYYSLGSFLMIQSCSYLTKKYISILWEKIHMTEF